MSVDAFLKLGDLKGESIVKGHEDEIQVLGWNWGMSQMGTTHLGTGGGAGKVDVQDITISKYVDTSSPNVALACCNGKHFDGATLTVRKAGETPLDYLIIEMKDVIITSYMPGGSSGAENVEEAFTLNFAFFKYSYQPQDNKGAKAGGAVEVEYNIAENA
jgi:type VI secretion system secreted protein Hcp